MVFLAQKADWQN
jgi:hypothetical protein